MYETENEKIKVQNLQQGPWDFHENIFPLIGEIYLSKDIFYSKEEHLQFSNNLFESLSEIAETILSNSFLDYDKNSIWDLFLVKYDKTTDFIRSQEFENPTTLYDLASKSSKNFQNSDELISNMMVILLNYQGRASANDQIDEKAMHLGDQGKNEAEKVSVKNQRKNENKDNLFGAFKTMKETKFNNRLQTVNNILKKLESKYFRDKFEKEEDRIKGTSNLPFSYVVEMLRDINDILLIYKENLFMKVTEALKKSNGN